MLNEKDKINALLIGCGNMGYLNDCPNSGNENKTISYAKALYKNGNFNVSCYDVDRSKMKACIETYKFNYFNPQIQYDLVIIATPDETHENELLRLLYLNPRLVICEKPMGMNYEQAKNIIKSYERYGINILVDYTRRFIPHWQKIKDNVKEGKYGKFKSYCVNYNRGKLHTGTHIADLFNMLGIIQSQYIFNYINTVNYRIYSVDLFFENEMIFERRIGWQSVWQIYNDHTKFVIDNAYGFITKGEKLLCDMYDGINAIEIIEKLT